MKNKYDNFFYESTAKLDDLSKQCENEMESWGTIDSTALEKSSSTLDAWDYCFSLAIGMAGAEITTSEKLEEYLNEIHHAASGATGEYTNLQQFLGKLLHHQGDSIDKLASEKHFINRTHESADVGYHRLLWGHDIFNPGEDNPFRLMIKQKGLKGILQAVRHLVADTTSKQGLPLPGSSYLDHTNENGKISNYLIEIAKNLSMESVGNKRNSQTIYSHMFTVRAQDITSGGAIDGFAEMYFKIRDIDDTIRKLQFHLIAYSVCFFGEALLGVIKNSGIPYINIPLATVVFKKHTQLYYYSIKETRQLRDITYELIVQGDRLSECVEKSCEDLNHYDKIDDYFSELLQCQNNVDALIEAFEEDNPNE